MTNSDTPLGPALRSALLRPLWVAWRLAPLPAHVRAWLGQRILSRFPGLTPPHRQGKQRLPQSRRALERAGLPALGHVPYRSLSLPSPLPATLVAFYLPQFHPIPENDAAWGRGFTEWHNVGRALPQFDGHQQPRLPADLGYYDLRCVQTLQAQAMLARDYGIGAFCFYLYWFDGKTVLELPLQQWLLERSIDLPFCLCWANENWTRRWDGRDQDVIISQNHSAEDDLAFIAHVAAYFQDPRYLRVDGKPLLVVYRPGLLPDPGRTADRWRRWCRDNGLGEIHIAYVQGFERPDPRDIGFDSAIEFPPNLSNCADITGDQHLINPEFSGQALDWRGLAADYAGRDLPDYPLFPGVNCGWDNEPRRSGGGRVYLHSSPRGYGDWLLATITRRLASSKASERLVFINAWNEWAEGAVLEPDARLGHAWLESTRSALMAAAAVPSKAAAREHACCIVVHAWYLEAFEEILDALATVDFTYRLVVTTAPEMAARIEEALNRRRVVAEVDVADNRGRDVLPFLRVADRLLHDGEDVVLKLHGKRSLQRNNGDQWRRELLGALAMHGHAGRILQAFKEDPGLGMVAPAGHFQPIELFWGSNKENVGYLATRIGIAPPRGSHARFVPGSMFWVRLEALRPLLDAHLDEWEFEHESGKIDGTFAHAVERVFALCADHQGMRIATSDSVCGEPTPDPATPYPYADRG